jgi:hypothetical protein
MFIELLIVCAIIMYLYSVGWLDFNNPHAILISVGIVVVVAAAGWALTHYLARSLVDSIFGFKAWSPKSPKRMTPEETERLRQRETCALPAIEQLVRENPKDLELSRRLSDEYLRRGQTRKFMDERLRILKAAVISREEACSIYNRLADVAVACKDYARAVEFLRALCEAFPNTVEAQNALRRVEGIVERAAMEMGTETES